MIAYIESTNLPARGYFVSIFDDNYSHIDTYEFDLFTMCDNEDDMKRYAKSIEVNYEFDALFILQDEETYILVFWSNKGGRARFIDRYQCRKVYKEIGVTI